MANILTYLWTLLTDLPAALRPRSPAKAPPQRAEGAQENCVRAAPVRRAPRPAPEEPILDAAGVERAMAELMSLFAQWKAGTLPPPPPPVSRYHPHPSWQPVQLRRPPAVAQANSAAAAAPSPRPPRRPGPARPPAGTPAAPFRPAPVLPRPPDSRRPLPPVPAPRHPAARPILPGALRRAVPRPPRTPHRGQAATRPTP